MAYPQGPRRVTTGQWIRRSAGDDTVVIGREACGFGQSLATTCRTAIPVGQLRSTAVEVVDYHFRRKCHLVHGPVRKVRQLFRMTQRETSRSTADVPGICGTCG